MNLLQNESQPTPNDELFQQECSLFIYRLLQMKPRHEEDRFESYEETIASALAGIDTDIAWILREEIMKSSSLKNEYILSSLARIDTERSWDMRRRVVESFDSSLFTLGLTGLTSDRAWAARYNIFFNHENILAKQWVVDSLGE